MIKGFGALPNELAKAACGHTCIARAVVAGAVEPSNMHGPATRENNMIGLIDNCSKIDAISKNSKVKWLFGLLAEIRNSIINQGKGKP